MGYRTDQFFNLPSGTGTGAEGQRSPTGGYYPVTAADNPPFPYPSALVRTTGRDGEPVTQQMKRGYIRSLVSSIAGVHVDIKKCGFQFNPSTITQNVAQPSSYLNFIQQDPGQYLQPMPGSVNFAFELMFDRSMELNNPTTNGGLTSETLDNPWELLPPSEVGVLRDLATLYAVIGQGMSKSQKDYVEFALTQTMQREAKNDDTLADQVSGDIGALSGDNGFLDANYGNAAFLMPVPVRAVFSSLYIVEGLVQTSQVDFLKFNTNYVPMQARVSLTMEAKYIGFAKARTFLTVALDQQQTDWLNTAKAEQSAIADVFGAIRLAAPSVEVAIAPPMGKTTGQFPPNGDYLSNVFGADFSGGPYVQNSHTIFARLPQVKVGTFTVVNADDPVKALYTEQSPTITDMGSVEVYGPFAAAGMSGVASIASKDLRAASTQNLLRSLATPTSVIFTAQVGGGPVSTGEAWSDMAKGSMSPSGLTFSATINWDSSKYYIIGYKCSVTAKANLTSGSSTYSGTGELWELIAPDKVISDYRMIRQVPVNWVPFTVADDALGSVDTQPPPSVSKPGTSSSVGKKKQNDANLTRQKRSGAS